MVQFRAISERFAASRHFKLLFENLCGIIDAKVGPVLRFSLALMIFVMSSSASPEVKLFTSDPIEEAVQGEPKSVRVERQEFQDIADSSSRSKAYLYATVEYFPGGLKAQKCVYHPDGTISSCESFEYDNQGRLSKTKSLSKTGAELQVQNVRWLDAWTEERVTLDAAGNELDCTITKRNNSGGVIESISTDRSQNSQIRLDVNRDSAGEIVGGEVIFEMKGEITSRIELTTQTSHQLLSKLCQPDGKVLVRTEMSRESTGRDLTRVLSETDNSRNLKIEQIESKDSKGNWTTKIISRRDENTQSEYSVVKFYRSFIYY